jgi:hypothetical protein
MHWDRRELLAEAEDHAGMAHVGKASCPYMCPLIEAYQYYHTTLTYPMASNSSCNLLRRQLSGKLSEFEVVESGAGCGCLPLAHTDWVVKEFVRAAGSHVYWL